MTLVESIKVCFSKYASFSGRASRSEFWWFLLVGTLSLIILMQLSITLYFIVSLLLFLPSLAVGTRRLHDTNRSGWWQLLNLIPIIGIIILIYFWIQEAKEPNNFEL